MQRYCVRCRAEIPAQRAARRAYFCSEECLRLDKIERRRVQAEGVCRLCGRPLADQNPTSGITQPEKVEIRPCAKVAQPD